MTTARNPLTQGHKHAYHQIQQKLKDWYGVMDAEVWFQFEVKRIKERCYPDKYGLAKHESLRDWWDSKQLEARYLK